MPLKNLREVSFTNNLDKEVSDVVVLYSESNKSAQSLSSLASEVDVEMSKNVLWNRELSFTGTIKPSQTCTISAKNICFGDNFGYWQLYFKYEKSTYKLEKNNLRMDLSPECRNQDLKITLSSSTSPSENIKMIAIFESEAAALEAKFNVNKGMPASRGMNIIIQNNLENVVDYVNLMISEGIPANSRLESESKSILFKETKIEKNDQISSSKRFCFSCLGNKHHIKLCFSYLNDCYEIDDTPVKLTKESYGDSMNIYIYQLRSEIMVKIRTNEGEIKLFTKNENMVTKRNRMFDQAKEINGLEFTRCVNQFQDVLKKLAIQTYGECIVYKRKSKQKIENDGHFFLSSIDDKALDEELIDGKRYRISIILRNNNKKNTLNNFKHFISSLSTLKSEWNKLKESLMKLNNSLEMVDKDNQLKRIEDDISMIKSMYMIDVLCNVLIPSGLNESGLTFYMSSCELKNISVNPKKLLNASEQELNIWKGSVFSHKMIDKMSFYQDISDQFSILILYQNNLFRLSELFEHIRIELIENLTKVASELHQQNRNTNISMVTASSTGIVGAGMTIAGLALAPFTAGTSLALMASGIAVGVTSGVVGVGVTIADGFLTKMYLNSTVSLAVNDHYICNQLAGLYPLIEKQSNLIKTQEVSSNLPESNDNSHFIMKNIAKNLSEAFSNMSVTILKVTVKTVKTIGLRVGTVVVGVIFDLTTLAFKSINLAKGGYSELGYKLESDALLLQQELEEHRSVMKNLRDTTKAEEKNLETIHSFFKIA